MEVFVPEKDVQLIATSGDFDTIAVELFPCKTCGKCFDKKSKLYNHHKIHSEKKYTCNVCFKTFSLKAYLDVHRQIHGPKKKLFKCPVCSKAFVFKKYLTTHLKIHSIEKQFKCPLCPKAFATASYLRHHRLTHTERKSFTCPICAKAFLLKEYLKRHVKTHSAEESYQSENPAFIKDEVQEIRIPEDNPAIDGDSQLPFTCPVCYKTLSAKRSLKRHMKTIHFERRGELSPEEILSLRHPLQNIDSEQLQYIERTLVCPVCNKRFSGRHYWIRHINYVHYRNKTEMENLPPEAKALVMAILKSRRTYKKQHTCKKCFREFSCRTKLRDHIQLQRCPRGYKCEMCDKYFKTGHSLDFHLNQHDEVDFTSDSKENSQSENISMLNANIQDDDNSDNKEYECEVCFEKFESKPSLTSHAKYHLLKGSYKCNMCSKVFMVALALHNHMRSHHSENTYECEVCYQSFPLKNTLENHMKIHIHSETYSCELCAWVFCSKNALDKHRLTHIGRDVMESNKFACETCGLVFEELSFFLVHMKEHTGIACQVCNKYLCNERSLRRHFKTQHEGEMMYKCDQCSSSFAEEEGLTKHRITHLEEQACEVCGEAFDNDLQLSKHMKCSHNEARCDICNKSFYNWSSLKRHMKTHLGEKPFTCEVCSKSFSQNCNLKAHKLIHTNERQFECGICSKAFKRKITLAIHQKRHLGSTFFKCEFCSKRYIDPFSLSEHRKNTGCGNLQKIS